MARAKILLSLLAGAVCLALAPSGLIAQSALAKPVPAAKPVFHPRIGAALGIFPQFTFRNGRLQRAQSASQPLTPLTYHGGADDDRRGHRTHDLLDRRHEPLPGAAAWGAARLHRHDRAVPHRRRGRQHGNVGTDVYQRPLQRLHRAAPVRIWHDTRRHHPWRVHRPPCPRRHDDRHPALPVEVRAVRLAQATRRPASPTPRSRQRSTASSTPPAARAACTTSGTCSRRPVSTNASPPASARRTPSVAITRCRISATARRSMPTRATRSSSRAAVNNPGNDPQGYPDAEHVIDIVAHEVNEAMTDPEGVGYCDPNGFETGDKCEFGPQFGTPLGFAPNGSPVQPGGQRPPVPDPGDVGQPGQHQHSELRPGDD